MLTRIRALCAAILRTLAPPSEPQIGALAIVPALALLLAGSLLLAGCSVPLPPLSGPDPSDPSAPAPRVSDRSTVAPYRSQRPVEPGPWGEQNQRVAPQPKSSQ